MDNYAETHLPVPLTAIEAAILELSNGSSTLREHGGTTTIVTAKRAYIWAAMIAEFLQASPQGEWPAFSDAVCSCLREIREELQADDFDPAGPDAGDMKVFYRLADELKLRVAFSGLEEKARTAYRSVIAKGLVEDPVTFDLQSLAPALGTAPMAAIMILGNLPISITKTTKQGEIVSRINALFWEYEYARSPEATKTRFEFRLLRFLKLFIANFPKLFSSAVSTDPGTQGSPVVGLGEPKAKPKRKQVRRR